ncbi:MAG: hypothetical protein F6K47_09980 [Symploca sp. SIO2E6]|nr:hypothetical protein [Symploca sp. SIO2E6]
MGQSRPFNPNIGIISRPVDILYCHPVSSQTTNQIAASSSSTSSSSQSFLNPKLWSQFSQYQRNNIGSSGFGRDEIQAEDASQKRKQQLQEYWQWLKTQNSQVA